MPEERTPRRYGRLLRCSVRRDAVHGRLQRVAQSMSHGTSRFWGLTFFRCLQLRLRQRRGYISLVDHPPVRVDDQRPRSLGIGGDESHHLSGLSSVCDDEVAELHLGILQVGDHLPLRPQ